MMVGWSGFALSDRRSSWSSWRRRRSFRPATTVQMRRSKSRARDSWRWRTCGSRARPRSRTARPNAILERPHLRISVCASSSRSIVQTGLRICSGVGEMRLAWDPPDRWRMDGASPDGGFTLLSTPDGDVRCRGTEVAASTCFATETSGPFASVVEAPERILAELGASGGSVVSAGPRRTIAGIPAECFRAIGGSAETSHRVEWCFSRSGLLLYLFDGVEGGRVTTVEATDVSEVVSDGDFVVPTT